jgi:lipoprotein-anchoring transpeptidase ErfK/SrfK
MGRKLQLSIVAAVAAAALGAFLLYWWDSAYDERIADGVRIGGVDVGGLEKDGAASQIRASLITPLQKNVVVRYGDEKFKLKAEDLNIHADVEGMVTEAVSASQEGGILGRSVRRLTGGEVEHAVEPQIAYSKDAVDNFLAGVAENINREAVDATVEPTSGSIELVSSQVGRSLDEGRLRRSVEQALQSPDSRKVEAKVEKVQPQVTTDELAEDYPTYIVVDRSNFNLRLYTDLELAKTYTVAIGAIGYDTPAGLYHIQNKQVNPVWNVPDSDWAGDLAGTTVQPGPDNPLKARWMGIYNGAGIHGTSDTGSLGSAASHGCIRMSVLDVKELYDRVATGTPIYIA